jgi:hypothetical protein
MRQILLGVIIASILASCSEKESLTFDKVLQQFSDQSQFFTITNDIGDTLATKNGTRIIIEPNTFVFNDGQDTEEPIQIEVKDVFDKSEMILNGLGTVSDRRLLESFGMVYLRATSDGRELKIRDKGSITISIPNPREGYYGELFYGAEVDRSLNWEYAGEIPDTTVIEETIMPLSDTKASVKRTTYKFINGLKEFVSDTVFTIKYQCCQDSVVGMEEAIYIPRAYEFEVTNLGWINCDRFIEISDKVDLEIELKSFSQPIGYIVFSDINSVMEILFDEKGKATPKSLPKGFTSDLIVIDKIKDNFMWTKQNLKIGTENKLTLETRKITADELKGELKKLDE